MERWWWTSASAFSSFNSSFLLQSSSAFQNTKIGNHHALLHSLSPSNYISINSCKRRRSIFINCTTSNKKTQQMESSSSTVDCVGTGSDVECLVSLDEKEMAEEQGGGVKQQEMMDLGMLLEWAILVSPFFFWGTAMVAMKEVLPKAGTFFVAAFRLIPAGLLLITFAGSQGRKLPSGINAWFSILLFALVDASCFQVSTDSLSISFFFFYALYMYFYV